MRIGNNQNLSVLSNRNFCFTKNKKDGVLEGIGKQIKNVQEQITKMSENKNMSAKQKMDRQKELRKQLDELNKQLMKRSMEIQEEERKKREEEMQEQMKNQSVQDEYTSAEGSASLNLMSLSTSLNQVSMQSAMHTKMKGQARVLEVEIKLDESRGVDVSNKKEQLSQITSRIENINKQIGTKLKDVNEEIKKGNEPSKEKEEIKEGKTDKADKTNKNNKSENIGNAQQNVMQEEVKVIETPKTTKLAKKQVKSINIRA